MFREIPVLPVVVPLAVVSLLVMTWQVRRRDLLTVPRAVVAVALCVYVAGVVANTVFPIFLDKPGGPGRWSIHSTLFADYEVVDAMMNIVVFAPVGVVVPLVVARASWWQVLGIATVFSLLIEVTQLVTARLLAGGHVADVNDLVFNVIGAAVGLALFSTATRWAPVSAVVERFRWR